MRQCDGTEERGPGQGMRGEFEDRTGTVDACLVLHREVAVDEHLEQPVRG
ncbi:hypothetical protein GCM10009548_83980 [Streptomyces malaysiensis subsp. malaysiensis]